MNVSADNAELLRHVLINRAPQGIPLLSFDGPATASPVRAPDVDPLLWGFEDPSPVRHLEAVSKLLSCAAKGSFRALLVLSSAKLSPLISCTRAGGDVGSGGDVRPGCALEEGEKLLCLSLAGVEGVGRLEFLESGSAARHGDRSALRDEVGRVTVAPRVAAISSRRTSIGAM